MIGFPEELLIFSADLIVSPACVLDGIEKLADLPRVQDHTINIQSGFRKFVGLVDDHKVALQNDAGLLLGVCVLSVHQEQIMVSDLKIEVIAHSCFFNKLRISASAWVVTVLTRALYADVGFDVSVQVKTVQIKTVAVQVILSQSIDGLTEFIGIMFDGGEVVILAAGT